MSSHSDLFSPRQPYSPGIDLLRIAEKSAHSRGIIGYLLSTCKESNKTTAMRMDGLREIGCVQVGSTIKEE